MRSLITLYFGIMIAGTGRSAAAAQRACQHRGVEKTKTRARRGCPQNMSTGKIRTQERMTRFSNNIMTVSPARFEQLQVKAGLVAVTMLPQRACN